MIYQLALLVVIIATANGLQMGSIRMSLSDYKNELAQTAKRLAGPGALD
jgi:hypothetical protein